jgi:crotonobetainyl-CoA:carnitine CoA-transferase CaiB-like acyl-CoA transferase
MAICDVLGLDAVKSDPRFETPAARLANRVELADILSNRTVDAPAWWWISALKRRGVPCGPVNYADDVMRDPDLTSCLEQPSTAWGTVWHGAKPWQFSRTPCPPTIGTRRPGEDQEEIESLITELEVG